MQQYLELLKTILENGNPKEDRTGVGTLSIFGHQMRFNLQKGFPIVTTKRIHFKSIVHELLWFLSGETNIRYLQDNKVRIWDQWADTEGNLGKVYGYQWRRWDNSLDQISDVIEQIKENPYSRRHIVTAWNPSEIKECNLPPCHNFFQFYINNNQLSCQLYQRSADVFLGLPFNISSYALLTHMIAQICGLQVGEFIHVSGDAHIYNNHIEQVKIQLQRKPFPLPTLKLNPEIDYIDDFKYEDIQLVGYKYHPHIKAEVAV